MTKIVGKIKRKFKTKFGTPVVEETPLADLSIWNGETAVYIETRSIQERSNKFRGDYRKVIMCITSAENMLQIPACRKLYVAFASKYNLSDTNANTNSKTYNADKFFGETVCGYIETLLQQRERNLIGVEELA